MSIWFNKSSVFNLTGDSFGGRIFGRDGVASFFDGHSQMPLPEGDLLFGDGGREFLAEAAGGWSGGWLGSLLPWFGFGLRFGSSDDDVLEGGSLRDLIFGLGGDDTLIGGPQRDWLFGGPDDDILDGGEGDDFQFGGPGDDTFISGPGRDTSFGGPDFDTFVFDGNRADYEIKDIGPAGRGIEITRKNADGDEATTERIFGVEELRFADQTVPLPDGQLASTAPGGFSIEGVAGSGDEAGLSVRSAGDFNGDGLTDVIFGAPGSNLGGAESGAAYIVFGKANGDEVSLSDVAAGAGGLVIEGIEGGRAGTSVSGAGDVNGDGLGDVIVGLPGANGGAGEAYVVFGTGTTDPISLSDIAKGDGGFAITGAADGSFAGFSVGYAGDINGDGLGDVILGSPGEPGSTKDGAAYVVFGKTTSGAVDLADISAGLGGFEITGVDGEAAGFSVDGAGDFNRDGLADIVLGATNTQDADGNVVGAVYIVYGTGNTDAIDLADVRAGIGGVFIPGEQDNGTSPPIVGRAVSGVGDFNGDQIDDIIYGAPGVESLLGAAVVVYGGTNGPSGNSIIIGDTEFGQAGSSVSGIGDLNNDGLYDAILSAPLEGGSGGTYVVYGVEGEQQILLDDVADGMGGFRLDASGGQPSPLGLPVSGAGDMNGDGFPDVVIGLPSTGTTGASSTDGGGLVVFGGPPNAVGLVGTPGDDNYLLPPANNNAFFAGLQGNDLMAQDAFPPNTPVGSQNGGPGNDGLGAAGGAKITYMTGGPGNDTFFIGVEAGATGPAGFAVKTVVIQDFFVTPFDGTGSGGVPTGTNQLSLTDFDIYSFANFQANADITQAGSDLIAVVRPGAMANMPATTIVIKNASIDDFSDANFFSQDLAAVAPTDPIDSAVIDPGLDMLDAPATDRWHDLFDRFSLPDDHPFAEAFGALHAGLTSGSDFDWAW